MQYEAGHDQDGNEFTTAQNDKRHGIVYRGACCKGE
jgi:hypothetical protein